MATSVAYFGCHPLGIDCFDVLDGFDDLRIEAVVTYPPDRDGWWRGSVHDRAADRGYTVYEMEDASRVLDHDIDYLLSVFYPRLIDAELLEHPNELPLNLHPAELPRYRGANVFSHAIMNARPDDHWEHGTTVHVMTEEMDAGDIIAQESIEITETDTARTLYEKTRTRSVELFESVLPAIASDEVHEMRTPQSEFDGPRYQYRKDSLEGLKEIDRSELADAEDAVELYDRIRALDFPPFEQAFVEFEGNRLYLSASSYDDLPSLEWTPNEE